MSSLNYNWDPEDMYCPSESWDSADLKFQDWIQNSFLLLLGKEVPACLQGDSHVSILRCHNENHRTVTYSGEGNLSNFMFELSDKFPGRVGVHNLLNYRTLQLPLKNLSEFDSLDEADKWLAENQGFYNPGWHNFLKKIEVAHEEE